MELSNLFVTNTDKHSFKAIIENAGDGGAFVRILFDVEQVFGKKRVKDKDIINKRFSRRERGKFVVKPLKRFFLPEEYEMKKTEFETMVDKAFWGLEAKYGFKKIETRFVDRSCTVQFRNATTEVLLNYELGNTPWLEISDTHNAENKSTLGWLLVELGVEAPPKPEQAFRPTTLSEGTLEPTLKKMGQQVLDYGAELLKGDFTIMPKLQARARKYDLECQRYLSIHKS